MDLNGQMMTIELKGQPLIYLIQVQEGFHSSFEKD